MAQIDKVTKERQVLEAYDRLFETYTQKLEAFRQSVAKKTQKDSNIFIVQHAAIVLGL